MKIVLIDRRKSCFPTELETMEQLARKVVEVPKWVLHYLAMQIHLFILEWLSRIKKHNTEVLLKYVDDRPSEVPLVTVCNHSSCIDDPLIWGKEHLSLLFEARLD